MKNELQKHKKSDGIKWFATLLAVLMLAVAVTAAITQGFKNWNPYGWFDKKEEQPVDKDETNDNSGMTMSPTENQGIDLKPRMLKRSEFKEYAISETAESAFVIKAVVKPVTVENKAIDWSQSFSNSSSEWAQGKTVTDYVEVVPLNDDGSEVKVVCNQSFGEQIILKATSRLNPDIFTESVVDYYMKVESVDFVFKYGDEVLDNVTKGSDGVYRVDYTREIKDYTVEVVPKYSSSTISDTFERTITGQYTDTFGYQSELPFTNISMQAYLKAGESSESPMEDYETTYVSYVEIACYANNGKEIKDALFSAGMSLVSGPLGGVYELKHSKALNAQEAYLAFFPNDANWDETELMKNQSAAREIFESYQSPAGSFTGGIEIQDEDALCVAALACCEANVGIMDFEITFAGKNSTYTYNFSLGYTESSLKVARDLEISLPSIIF